MAANEVSRERWSFQLPHLTGKAQQAYAALPPEDTKTYDTVKEAILRRYDINEETYRQRFRKLRPKEGESPQELITRLKDLATRWTRESKPRDDLLDLIVREQFLAILPEDIRVSVIERQPKDGEEGGRFAGNYLQARSMSIARREKKASAPTTKCPRCGRHGHWAHDCTKSRDHDGRDPRQQAAGDQQQPTTTSKGSRPQNRDITAVRCFNCNEKAHFSSSCPKRSLYCGQPEGGADGQDRACRHGTVNGVYCTDILVDTGATQTLVRKDLVADDDILDGKVTIRCAHGDTAFYPLAVVKINVGGKDIITTASVSSTLPVSVLLGWDVPDLMDFVADGQSTRNKADALAVMTRRRRRQQQESRDRESSTIDAEASPNQVELTPAPENLETNYLFNFDDSIFVPAGPSKPTLTRVQKREDRRRHRYVTEEAGYGQPGATPEELRKLQDNDEILSRPRIIAAGAPGAAAGEKFFCQDGLVYPRYSPPGSDDDAHSIDHLVLPTLLHPAVLKLAHDIPMAGHLDN